jgi:dipeptide transport system substrate-binding protein
MFTEGYLNESRWKNKEYIDLVTKAKIASGIPARSALYYKAERILMEEAPVLMLARGKAFMPMSKKVQGFVINPNGYLDFSPVSLDK